MAENRKIPRVSSRNSRCKILNTNGFLHSTAKLNIQDSWKGLFYGVSEFVLRNDKEIKCTSKSWKNPRFESQLRSCTRWVSWRCLHPYVSQLHAVPCLPCPAVYHNTASAYYVLIFKTLWEAGKKHCLILLIAFGLRDSFSLSSPYKVRIIFPCKVGRFQISWLLTTLLTFTCCSACDVSSSLTTCWFPAVTAKKSGVEPDCAGATGTDEEQKETGGKMKAELLETMDWFEDR